MRQHRRTPRPRILILALAATALLGPGPPLASVSAQPQADVEALERSLIGLSPVVREQKLIDGARQEGGQVITYLTWNERQSQDVADSFQKRYPLMRVRVLRGGSGDVANRILTEGRAGRATWDAAEVDTGFIPSLERARLLSRYTSFARNAINRKFFDPEGWWTGILLEPVVLAWNTEKVPRGAVPRTYEDLTRPEWRGNFSLDTEDYDFFAFVLATRGKEKGMALMRALAANKPRMVRGRTTQAELLLAGEFAASAALFDYRVVDARQKGAPIDFTYVEPVFMDISPVLLARSPVHPNGALLFLDWLISQPGQQMIADLGRTPVRTDVRLKYEQLRKPFTMALYVYVAGDADQNALIAQYNQLFGLSSGK